MTYLRTFTGKKVYPLSMYPDDLDIRDIARGLSLQNRFLGHTRVPYSVAEHSVRCGLVAPRHLKLAALLHDASEAYLCDIPRPLKRLPVFHAYRNYEARLEEVIAQKWGTPFPMPPEIKEIDNRMLATEIRDLLPADEPCPYEPYPEHIRPVGNLEAELTFLTFFDALTR